MPLPTDNLVLLAIGASAGGVIALERLVADLPADLPAAVLVVLHLPARGNSVLPDILDRSGRLPAAAAEDGDRLQASHIYVAAPGRHLGVSGTRIALTTEPEVHGHRPAVDTLFRSAAESHGHAVVGVVLSGMLDDGTAGLCAIKAAGGATVVQDPDDALYAGMPTSAIDSAPVDHVERLDRLAPLLARLAQERATIAAPAGGAPGG